MRSIPAIVVAAEPTPEDRQAILAPLVAYNEERAGPSNAQVVAILLRDPDSGGTVGGLWGRIVFRWLFVELLAVPERMRGHDLGRTLMRRAEDIARENDCVGIWLDTFSFQARGFYEKLGYAVFGTIEDHPPGHHRSFLQKRL